MGMDFQYAGSASYPRFDRSIEVLARILGARTVGEMPEEVGIYFKKDKDGNLDKAGMFGTLFNAKEDTFIFPEGTDERIVKFFNHPYDTLDTWKYSDIYDWENIEFIYDKLMEHEEEITKYETDKEYHYCIDSILYEMKEIIKCHDSWQIS